MLSYSLETIAVRSLNTSAVRTLGSLGGVCAGWVSAVAGREDAAAQGLVVPPKARCTQQPPMDHANPPGLAGKRHPRGRN